MLDQLAPAALDEIFRERTIREEAPQQDLTKQVSRYYEDPLGFVMQEWPWGEVGGPLEHTVGPDDLQKKFLVDLGEHIKERKFDGKHPVDPIRMCISSAHGTGKSSMGALIAWFILRTRPNSIGTVTAGTFQQLQERTWAEIMYWGHMAKGGHLFDIQRSGVYHKDIRLREKWKVTPKTASPENAQAFAGQHAATSTSWFLMDEASEIPDSNWIPCYNGMTDGHPMMFAWGQMIQNQGEFHNICYGKSSEQWDHRVWDGRDSAFTSKKLIAEFLEEYGEDSDFFRVRVAGLPPRASSLQFINQEVIDGARERTHRAMEDEPLVVGFDAANGGMAKFCIFFRRGLDAKSIPPIFLPGDTSRSVVIAKLADIMGDRRPGRRVAALFGDQAFGAVILEALRNSGFTNVFEVNFGEPSNDRKFLNMRAYMWFQMREWLNLGAIPDDEKLAQQFMAPGFHHRNGRLVLESKESMAKRKVKSPDGPDALAVTFFRRVAAPPPPARPSVRPTGVGGSMGWVR